MGLFLMGPTTIAKPDRVLLSEVHRAVTLNLLTMEDFSKFLNRTGKGPYEGFRIFKEELNTFDHLNDFDELHRGYFRSLDDFMTFMQREMFCNMAGLHEPINELLDVFLSNWASHRAAQIIDSDKKLVYTEVSEDELAFALGLLVPLGVRRFHFTAA
jgi:hypothetical protein